MTADQLLDSLSQCEVRVAKVLRLVQDAVGGGRDAVEHELALRRRSSVQGELARRSSVGAAGVPSGAARRRASNAARVGAADMADAYNIRVKPPEQINAALALDDDDAAMKKAIDEVLPKIEVVPTRESLKHESEKARGISRGRRPRRGGNRQNNESNNWRRGQGLQGAPGWRANGEIWPFGKERFRASTRSPKQAATALADCVRHERLLLPMTIPQPPMNVSTGLGIGVSVVIPSFSRPENIPQMLSSLLLATCMQHDRSEVLIVHGSQQSLERAAYIGRETKKLCAGRCDDKKLRHLDLVRLNDKYFVGRHASCRRRAHEERGARPAAAASTTTFSSLASPRPRYPAR